MAYTYLMNFIPEALEEGEHLPGNGYRELVSGVAAGIVVMVPLLAV